MQGRHCCTSIDVGEPQGRRCGRYGQQVRVDFTSVEEAHTILAKLPLGQAKLMEFAYVELTPVIPLHMLLTEGWANGIK